ncbi:MAG: glyoxalase [Ferruginibacter sp.]
MIHQATSLRPFIGAADFEESRHFYKELGFQESAISGQLSYFSITPQLGFYLQNAYVKDWVDNTMLFVEVKDAEDQYRQLEKLALHQKYKNVRLIPIKDNDWGRECFLHDPAGILWHFGQFK